MNVQNRSAVESLSVTLDKGEAEAIVLSKEKDALLLIDDSDGRRTARTSWLEDYRNGRHYSAGFT